MRCVGCSHCLPGACHDRVLSEGISPTTRVDEALFLGCSNADLYSEQAASPWVHEAQLLVAPSLERGCNPLIPPCRYEGPVTGMVHAVSEVPHGGRLLSHLDICNLVLQLEGFNLMDVGKEQEAVFSSFIPLADLAGTPVTAWPLLCRSQRAKPFCCSVGGVAARSHRDICAAALPVMCRSYCDTPDAALPLLCRSNRD